MSESVVLRLIYTFFVGFLLAMFVGVGIDAFYAPPAAPRYPTELNTLSKEPTEEQIVAQEKFNQAQATHDEAMKPYNRNISLLTLGAAVISLIVSIVWQDKIKFIADGVMLGGLFTLLYSVGRGLAADNSRYEFIIVTVGLCMVLFMGYRRFVIAERRAKIST